MEEMDTNGRKLYSCRCGVSFYFRETLVDHEEACRVERLRLEKLAYDVLAKSYNDLVARHDRWVGVMAMMERVVAAHPCNVEHCSCRELREKIKGELGR